MQIFRKINPIFIALIVLMIAAFGLALFHSHPDGDHHRDCPVCRLVQQFSFILILAVVGFIAPLGKTNGYFLEPIFFKSLPSFSPLQDRAPPRFS
jgi:hypothetical protein